jgi:hypothetical protein
LVGDRHTGVGFRGSRSGCRIADDTGEVDAHGIAPSRRTQYEHMFSALLPELGHCTTQLAYLNRAKGRYRAPLAPMFA